MSASRFLALLAVWAVAASLLWWPSLPAWIRRGLALAASAAGLVFLAIGLNTVGWREEATTAGFLIGAAYETGRASASASLPYYVLTGLCLLLGTAALALPESAAAAMRRHWVASAVALSIGVTFVRLLLERAAAPPRLAWAFGITALAPLVGAFFRVSARGEGKGWRHLLQALAVYALAARAWVAVLYTAATLAAVGSTHYDVSRVLRARNPLTRELHLFAPGSLEQVMALVWLPQILFWPLYTVCAGLIGAALAELAAVLLGGRRGGFKAVTPPVEMAAAGQD